MNLLQMLNLCMHMEEAQDSSTLLDFGAMEMSLILSTALLISLAQQSYTADTLKMLE